MNSQNKVPFKGIKKTVSPRKDASNECPEEQSHAFSPGHWQVILGELIHLLGLFLAHSRSAKGTRATAVIFDQLVSRLSILEKMPGHEGALLLRRSSRPDPSGRNNFPEYLAIFGNISLEGRGDADTYPDSAGGIFNRASSHLKSALNQCFSCLTAQGIDSLYLKLPGESDEEIDRLRLSLNIIARFRFALENTASITFRYFGRDLTIPLVKDIKGIPDPNLTLVAGLNGLSAVNAGELVKQAAAYHKMDMVEIGNSDSLTSFNQIFSVRSLRSQIIKPPVEVNNLPWMDMADLPKEVLAQDAMPEGPGDAPPVPPEPVILADPISMRNDRFCDDRPDSILRLIAGCVESDDMDIKAAVDALLADEYAAIGPKKLAERFLAVTRLLNTIDKHCPHADVMSRLLCFFQEQLVQVPDDVMARIAAHRQGLRIISNGRTLLVGMVHPRLFDLITLVKDQVSTRKKIETLKCIDFDFGHCDLNALADNFEISTDDARNMVGFLDVCFDARGRFRRSQFETHIRTITRNEETIFEILWFYLNAASRRKDRLDMLSAIQLPMALLKRPVRALRFLLADVLQVPLQVNFTDRNALALINILIRAENKELHVDIHHTPEEVLQTKGGLNPEVLNYALWRFEADRARVLYKTRAVRRALLQSVSTDPGEKHIPYEPVFLLALEREAIILMALVGGGTARMFLREALTLYGDFRSDIYHGKSSLLYMRQLISQLQVIIRGLGRVGQQGDLDELKALEQNAEGLSSLHSHPAHALRVKQAMKWVGSAIKAIQIQV